MQPFDYKNHFPLTNPGYECLKKKLEEYFLINDPGFEKLTDLLFRFEYTKNNSRDLLRDDHHKYFADRSNEFYLLKKHIANSEISIKYRDDSGVWVQYKFKTPEAKEAIANAIEKLPSGDFVELQKGRQNKPGKKLLLPFLLKKVYEYISHFSDPAILRKDTRYLFSGLIFDFVGLIKTPTFDKKPVTEYENRTIKELTQDYKKNLKNIKILLFDI